MLQGSQVLQGRYQLKQQLGQNAGRQTWLAADIETSPAELVIVKLLAFSPQMQWDDFKLFEREAQVLKNLKHPRIPRYRDYFSLDKQTGNGLCWFALVQEYIPGASLQQLLNQGKHFTETQVRQIATNILNILIDLHRLSPSVLHRDIKPSNLILGEDGHVYLVDFGAVQDQAAAEGVTFTVVGTTGYAPLEQFWGRAVPASDLYALGATLIHLLTGIPPANLPQQNLRIQFSDRVSINPNFVRWIEALTAPDLDQRYSTARQALDDLQANRYLNAPLQKVRPPAGSRIQLWKSPTQMKIELPGRGIYLLIDIIALGLKLSLAGVSVLTLLVLGILIFVLIWSSLIALVHWHQGGIAVLIFLIPLALILGNIFQSVHKELTKIPSDLKRTRFNALGSYSLVFYEDYFIIKKKLFGWTYFLCRNEISRIYKFERSFFKELKITVGSLTYSLGRELTESERKWLFQEIQTWLKLLK